MTVQGLLTGYLDLLHGTHGLQKAVVFIEQKLQNFDFVVSLRLKTFHIKVLQMQQ